MISEKSLANLRMPKAKREGYGYRYSIPQEKIDELFTYLAEGMALKKAAKEAKISFETARKYYKQGDIKRGIKPLRFRLTMFQEKISENMNVKIEERRMKMLTLVQKALAKMEERIDQDDLLSKPNLNNMDKLIRLEIFLSGGLSTKTKEQKMLTAEDLGGDNS